MNQDNSITAGLALSVLIHIILGITLFLQPLKKPEEKKFFEVSYVKPEELLTQQNKKQIISATETAEEAKVVPPTNLESDKNTSVVKESIKRGEPGLSTKGDNNKPSPANIKKPKQ